MSKESLVIAASHANSAPDSTVVAMAGAPRNCASDQSEVLLRWLAEQLGKFGITPLRVELAPFRDAAIAHLGAGHLRIGHKHIVAARSSGADLHEGAVRCQDCKGLWLFESAEDYGPRKWSYEQAGTWRTVCPNCYAEHEHSKPRAIDWPPAGDGSELPIKVAPVSSLRPVPPARLWPKCACGQELDPRPNLPRFSQNGVCGDCYAARDKDLDVRPLSDRIALAQTEPMREERGAWDWDVWSTAGSES